MKLYEQNIWIWSQFGSGCFNKNIFNFHNDLMFFITRCKVFLKRPQNMSTIFPTFLVTPTPSEGITVENILLALDFFEFLVFLILFIYFLSYFIDLKKVLLKLPFINTLNFEKIKEKFEYYKKFKFFIIATFIFIYRILSCLSQPTYGLYDIVLPCILYLLSLVVSFFIFKNGFSFLEKVPLLKKLVKKTTPNYYKIKEIDLNFSYLTTEDETLGLKALKDLHHWLITNFWVLFALLIILPEELTSFINWLIIFFIFFICYLFMKILDLKTELLIKKFNEDPESFIRYKYFEIKKNEYLAKKRWATTFITNFDDVIMPPLALGTSRRTIISAQFKERMAAGFKTITSSPKIQGALVSLGLAAGAAAGDSVKTAIDATDANVSKVGQTLDYHVHGAYHYDRTILNFFQTLKTKGFITPENQDYFLDKNGRISEEHVRQAYQKWIVEGPVKEQSFQDLLKTDPRKPSFIKGAAEIIGSEPLAASAPSLDPDLGKNIGKTIAKTIKKD
jgi:hypothetical protein